jgi:hypothetical protein
MFNHMGYNRTAIQNVMPNDTIYVGIIRDPQTRFMASIYYFSNLSKLKPPKANGTRAAEFSRYWSDVGGHEDTNQWVFIQYNMQCF